MTNVEPEGHRYAPSRLFLVALVFVAAAPVFWLQIEVRHVHTAQSYENASLYQRVYPMFQYGFSRLKAGDIPLWNPNQYCGVPYLADPETGLFQPLNAVFLFLPTEKALAAHAYICLSLMGFFFVLFARALGVGYIAALTGGVAYAFCGVAASAMPHPPLIGALVWTPFLFWGLREYTRNWRIGAAVLAGLGGGMLILSGTPAIAVAVLCLWIPYRLYLLLFPGDGRPPYWKRAAGGVTMGCIALSVSAVQWLPSAAWLFSLDQPMAALWRLDWAGGAIASWEGVLAQLLDPKPDTLPRIGYAGIATLLAVPAVLFRSTSRRDAVFFAVGAALCLLAVSKSGEMAPLGYPMQAFMVPAMLCLAALAALGLDRLFVPAAEPHAPTVWLPAIAVVLAAGGLFYACIPEVRGRVLVLGVALVPFLLFRTRPLTVICGLATALLLFIDLTLASVNVYRHPSEDAPECYRWHSGAITAAQEQSLGGRLLLSTHPLDPSLPANLGMIFPIPVAEGGYIPLTADQTEWWAALTSVPEMAQGERKLDLKALESPLPDYMAVRAVLAAPEGALYNGFWNAGKRFRPIRTEGNVRLFVNEDALPRAHWVPSWQLARSAADAVGILSAPEFDGTRQCTVQMDSPGLDALAALVPETQPDKTDNSVQKSQAAVCSVVRDDPERVELRVEGQEPGVTILADSYAAGWRATLDGIPWPILRVNGLFRGIATPAGTHEIVFEYRSRAFTAGLAISLVSLIFIALAGMTAFARRG